MFSNTSLFSSHIVVSLGLAFIFVPFLSLIIFQFTVFPFLFRSVRNTSRGKVITIYKKEASYRFLHFFIPNENKLRPVARI